MAGQKSINCEDSVLGYQEPTDCVPPSDHLIHVLEGVAHATKATEKARQIAEDILVPSSTNASQPFSRARTTPIHNELGNSRSLEAWHALIKSVGVSQWDTEATQISSLTVAVTCLRKLSRDQQAPNATEIALIWDLITLGLTRFSNSRELCTVSRSAQGFLAVPLCSLTRNGNIEELFRLHVWLPDGKRGNPEFPLHSHQPFAQSWILAGKGIDHSYEVVAAEDLSQATHTKFALMWSDGKGLDKSYKTFQTHSTVKNTGEPFRAAWKRSEAHTRGMTYLIPSGAYHASEVDPDAFHATLFFFDAQRGFEKDAGVLGPPHLESFTQLREVANVTAENLKTVVLNLRAYEEALQQGQQQIEHGEIEDALKSFNYALDAVDSLTDITLPEKYRQNVLGELGKIQQRFGEVRAS